MLLCILKNKISDQYFLVLGLFVVCPMCGLSEVPLCHEAKMDMPAANTSIKESYSLRLQICFFVENKDHFEAEKSYDVK